MAAVVAPGTPSPAATPAPAGTAPPAGERNVTTDGSAEAQDTTAEVEGPALKDLAKKTFDKVKKKGKKPGAGEKVEAGTDEPAADGEAATVEPPKGDITAESLFTPEALASEDGIKKARDLLIFAKEDFEKKHRRFDRANMRLEGREKAITTREGTVQHRERAVETVRQGLLQRLQLIRGERVSNPLQICATLDEIAGGKGDPEAGRVLAEQIMIALARDGKPVAETESEKRLRLKLESMEETRRRELEQAETGRLDNEIQVAEHRIATRELQIGTHAVTSGQFHGVAGFVATGGSNAAAVGKWVTDVMKDAYDKGEPLDVNEAIGILDEKLAPYAGQRAVRAEVGSGQPEVAEVASPPAKRGERQSTILPSDADRSGGAARRKETRDERQSRLARDPEFLKRLGPVFANAAGVR